jgi:hypothetical protein
MKSHISEGTEQIQQRLEDGNTVLDFGIKKDEIVNTWMSEPPLSLQFKCGNLISNFTEGYLCAKFR